MFKTKFTIRPGNGGPGIDDSEDVKASRRRVAQNAEALAKVRRKQARDAKKAEAVKEAKRKGK